MTAVLPRPTTAVELWPDYTDTTALVLVDRDRLYHNPQEPCDPLATGWAWLPLADAYDQCIPCDLCRRPR